MNFIFRKLRITDVVNKCSKSIRFSERDNLITSDKNSMGKSILLKSLYHTLGADSSFDKNFDEQNVLFSLEFDYGVDRYQFLRFKNAFSILKNGKLSDFIKAKSRTDLSQYFKSEFGLSVYLKNREKTTEIAPPAYLFMPYYLDQDRSWKEDQDPFSKKTAGQYESLSKNELYLYHLGIYTSEYGAVKSEVDSLNNTVNNQKSELTKLDEEYNKTKKIFDNEFVTINLDELESIYRCKSKEFNKLLTQQNEMMEQLFQIDQKRTKCLLQISNNKKVISKIENNNNSKSFVVQCPNCKEEFDVYLKNEVISLYSKVLLEKENESLQLEEKQLAEEIKKIKQSIYDTTKSINEADNEMKKSRADYEKYVARKALSSLLNKQLSEIGTLDKSIELNNAKLLCKRNYLQAIKSKATKAKDCFCRQYSECLISLGIYDFDAQDIFAFKKLRLSGSQYIRSTLALYFAFLKTKMKQNYDNFSFPLVIDSPREGEQDDHNSSNILETILSENMGNLQRIVASVNAQKYLSPQTLSRINLIELNGTSNHVMSSLDYEKNEQEIELCMSYFKRV